MRERAGRHDSLVGPGCHLRVVPRRGARAAESARLESVCGATHRGFESHSLRHARPAMARVRTMAIGPTTRRWRSPSRRPSAAGAAGDVPDRRRRPASTVRSWPGPATGASATATRPPTPRCWPCARPPPQRGSWRLDGATLVVTLEPCPMCAGALRRGPGRPGRVRRRQHRQRRLRDALQPLRRPPAQPRGRGRPRRPGRGGHRAARRASSPTAAPDRRRSRARAGR